MILNIKSEITKYEKTLFQNAGVAHILVVSGLHFYLISLISYYLLLIITNEKLKYLILSIILLNYLILTGFTPSTLRAFLMTESLIIYKLIYGKINLISCTSISFIINAITFPETLNSIGFQLSYLATIGISASVYLKNRYNLKRLTSLMLTTFFIQIFTSPVIYVNNFDLAPISMLSNLIVIPLTLIFLLITILSLITYFLSLNLFFLLDLINAYVFQTIKITAIFFSKFFIVKHHQIPIFLILSILLITYIIYNNETKKLQNNPKIAANIKNNMVLSLLSMNINYNSITSIKQILKERKIAPRKLWGQNYLINENIRQKIIESLDIKENEKIWEIGPGLGAMTDIFTKKNQFFNRI